MFTCGENCCTSIQAENKRLRDALPINMPYKVLKQLVEIITDRIFQNYFMFSRSARKLKVKYYDA